MSRKQMEEIPGEQNVNFIPYEKSLVRSAENSQEARDPLGSGNARLLETGFCLTS